MPFVSNFLSLHDATRGGTPNQLMGRWGGGKCLWEIRGNDATVVFSVTDGAARLVTPLLVSYNLLRDDD